VTFFGWEDDRRPGGNWQPTAGVTEKVTCVLNACIPGSTPGPTLGKEYGRTFNFFGAFLVRALCRSVILPCSEAYFVRYFWHKQLHVNVWLFRFRIGILGNA